MNGLKRILDRLGLKQTQFAQLLNVSPRTVSLWATGEVALPGPVRAYLRMLQFADPPARAAEFMRLHTSEPPIPEGLYSFSYTRRDDAPDTASAGDAVALLRAGRVIGSDGWGGTFEGTYVFDSARRTYQFRVWLRVPPCGTVITGVAPEDSGDLVEVIAELDRADPVAFAVAQLDGRPVDLSLAYLGPVSC